MPGLFKSIGNFFTGTPERREQISRLRPSQEPLAEQSINAGLRPGAGGAFGDAADYYRGNLSNNPQDFDAFAAPELRQFNEQTIPGLAEQFAGMGSGGLSSSGFQNSAVNAGSDLAERLGAIRANLRSNSAAGLANIGQQGLQNYDENVIRPGTPGFLDQIGPLAGQGLGIGSFGQNIGAQGGGIGNWFKNSLGGDKVGKNRHPYNNTPVNAPQQNFQPPNFNNRIR